MPKPAQGQPKRFHFTVKQLESLPIPTDRPVVYFDDDPRQLGIRVQPTGTKTLVCIKRANGVTYRKTLGSFPDLQIDAARIHARRLVNENANWKAGGYKETPPLAKPLDEKAITFETAFQAHVIKARARMAKKLKDPAVTEKGRKAIYDLHLAQFGNLPLEAMTPSRIVDLHKRIGEKCGPYAANRTVELVRAVFNTAIKKEWWKMANPTASVDMNPEQKRKGYFEPEELVRLEKVLADERNQDVADFVRLLIRTGVRKSSLYQARWEHIDFARKVWAVPITKSGAPLDVQLTPEAIAIFKKREQQRNSDSHWVFPTKSESKDGHVTDYKAQWYRIRKAAGVLDKTMHHTRHTNASYKVIGGVSLPLVGGSLGHADMKSTETYSHLHQSAIADGNLTGEVTMRKMMRAAARKLKSEEKRKARKLQVVSAAS
jgi:integrase